MRKILFGLLLLLGSSAYAESGGFFGVKLMQDIGMEGGLLWKHVGLKAYCSADYSYSSIYVLGSTNDDSSSNYEPDRYDGNRYHLAYGGGFMIKLFKPMWLSLNAGYAWSGKHSYDETLTTKNKYGSINNVKGLEIGADLIWNFDGFYISAGYSVMPSVMKNSNPINLFSIAIGGFTDYYR